MIDFWLGQPHPSILEAARRTIAENCLDPLAQQVDSPLWHSALQYGENAGEPAFLASLTQWLNETLYRNVDEPVNVNELFVTNGASQALLMLARALCALRRRRVVFCEEATYFLALDVFVHDLNLTVRGVPTDEHGMDVHALTSMLTAAADADALPAFIYLIPTHHNPTARTVSDERRRELIAVARRFNVAIVADDPYALLSFRDDDQQPQLTPMSALGYRHVYDVGSFSKILAPGIRLGWLRTLDAELLADLNQNDGLIQSGGGLAPFTSVFVRSLLTGGAQTRFIAWLRLELRQRCAALCDALQTAIDARRQLIDTVHFVWPRGGYFVWLHVGDGAGKTVAARALQRGVRVLPGTRCLAEPHDNDRDGGGRCKGRECRRAACSLRLCFAWASRDDLVAGAHALVNAIVSNKDVATESHH